MSHERYKSPVTNPAYIVKPMEKHVFMAEAFDTEACEICGRNRAAHLNDGFIPNKEKPKCCMDKRVKYNRHPQFFKVGDVPDDEFGKGPRK